MREDTCLGKVYSVSPGLPGLCLGRKIKLDRIRLLNSKAHSVFYRIGGIACVTYNRLHS
jgi:hypothetical protein